ncbi:MAG: hypothetical protein APF80_00010 [Alphaproteobacteria bacterium BRH_c36]|nr:MAG: hypothetical protein APF80_00010 [Alphaproteobacteria bacterium BRH_c36]
MSRIIRTSQFAALGAALVWSASASADSNPKGIWFDHDGRGAVEIKDCEKGGGLCGFVVHVKDKKNEDRCGTQILGNVTSKGGGWIYSPSRGKKYTVRLTRLDSDNLRVVGNASSSFFSKTFTWKRAPENVQFCGQYAAAKNNTIASNDEPAVADQPAAGHRIERHVVRRADRDIVEAPQRFTTRSSIAAQEEAELERNTGTPANETAAKDGEASKDVEVEADSAKAYGAVPEGDQVDEKPIENEVTQVIDELVDRANEYTGKMKRKCKFHIPYIDKVIMIPCKD